VTRPRAPLFAPKEPIPPGAAATAAALLPAALGALWCGLAYGGLVDPIFLPPPHEVILSAVAMARDGSLSADIAASLGVILTGFAVASALAVPLGILMGSFRIVEAFVAPVVEFVRYLPVSALIPLLILWIGIDFPTRVAIIFIGTFFQQVILIADVSAHVSRELLEVGYTLGATRGQIFTRVLAPATLPGVMDSLRITLGWAWTYLVVAELLAANKGLGYLILSSMRGLFTDRIFVGILTIGLLGLASDQLFRWLHRTLLPWSPKA
jgi:NitT/TauT family transport system permease protein